MTTLVQHATATLEGNYVRQEYYPDVKEALADMDIRLDQLRDEWLEAAANEDPVEARRRKDEIERKAFGLNEARTRKQFRLNRHEDEVIAERYSLDDSKDYDSTLPQSDSEWLSWKVNKFIKGISHRTKSGSLYVGRVRINNVKDGRMEFRCYAKGCAFHANHSVVNGAGVTDVRRVELRIARILAHYYKHA